MKKSGYKFRPSGEELLVHLIHHVAEAPLDGGEIIKGLDLYGDSSDPWTVLHESTEQDGAWYVITRVKKGQSRIKRTAGCGTWKEQNSHIVPLHYGGVEYKGLNRYFVFQPKKGSCYRREAHGHWIMNEYSLDAQDCVICEIRNKDGGRKRSRCEYESLDDYLASKEKNNKMRMSNVVDVEAQLQPQPQSVAEIQGWPHHQEDVEEFLVSGDKYMMGMSNVVDVEAQPQQQRSVGETLTTTTTTTHHQEPNEEQLVLVGEIEQGGSDVVVSETEPLSVEEVEGWLVEHEQTLTTTPPHHHQQEQEQGGVVSEDMSTAAGDVEVTTSHHQHQDKEQGKRVDAVVSEAEASERSGSGEVEDHLWYEDCMWMMEQTKSMDYQEWLTSLQTEIQLINTLTT